MNINYKNYELQFDENGDVDCIVLDGEEVGFDDCPGSGETHYLGSLADAVEWINEDIKCRKEEEEEKVYLEEGDILYIEGANAIVGKNNVICFDGWRDDVEIYCDGYVVEYDDDERLFITK